MLVDNLGEAQLHPTAETAFLIYWLGNSSPMGKESPRPHNEGCLPPASPDSRSWLGRGTYSDRDSLEVFLEVLSPETHCSTVGPADFLPTSRKPRPGEGARHVGAPPLTGPDLQALLRGSFEGWPVAAGHSGR